MRTRRTRRGFLAGSTATGTALLAGCTSRGERTERAAVDRQFDAGDAQTVAVVGTTGDVTVLGTDRDDVAVEGEIAAASESALEDASVDARREGDQLVVDATTDGSDSWFQFGPGISVDVDVEVPSDLAVDRVDVSTGDVAVSDVAGAVTADVATGDVEVDGVEEPVTVEASTGDVTVEGPVASLETTTGAIEATVDGVAEPATVEVTTGDVDLVLAPDLDVRVEAETTTGDVQFEGEFDEADVDDNDGTAVLGGGETTLTAAATTGSVTVSTR